MNNDDRKLNSFRLFVKKTRRSTDDKFPTFLLVATVVSLIAVSFIPYKDSAAPGGLWKPDITNGIICVAFFLIGVIREAFRKNFDLIRNAIKEIDYYTVALLAGLFVVIGGIEKAGVIDFIGSSIAGLGSGSAFAIFLRVSPRGRRYATDLRYHPICHKQDERKENHEMRKDFKRISFKAISLVLTVLMVLSVLPLNAGLMLNASASVNRNGEERTVVIASSDYQFPNVGMNLIYSQYTQVIGNLSDDAGSHVVVDNILGKMAADGVTEADGVLHCGDFDYDLPTQGTHGIES